ncbi:hypothetical protein BD779DRAFT_1520003 [Infundibulicybe gibba]|nr:hypothetical protein BD779DRAFT_1520003 [Infundibulicybe gibba]
MALNTPVLSDHLISLPTSQPYSAAIAHPFLHAAGNGLLGRRLLSLWLSQDRIYASHAYPRFIGALISNIPFGNRGSSPDADALNKRILDILVFSLNNVLTEVKFFESTAKKWNLDISNYTAEMARIGNSGNIEDGLVFLWAMEKVSSAAGLASL